jgi:hypothetical protein
MSPAITQQRPAPPVQYLPFHHRCRVRIALGKETRSSLDFVILDQSMGGSPSSTRICLRGQRPVGCPHRPEELLVDRLVSGFLRGLRGVPPCRAQVSV